MGIFRISRLWNEKYRVSPIHFLYLDGKIILSKNSARSKMCVNIQYLLRGSVKFNNSTYMFFFFFPTLSIQFSNKMCSIIVLQLDFTDCRFLFSDNTEHL